MCMLTIEVKYCFRDEDERDDEEDQENNRQCLSVSCLVILGWKCQKLLPRKNDDQTNGRGEERERRGSGRGRGWPIIPTASKYTESANIQSQHNLALQGERRWEYTQY